LILVPLVFQIGLLLLLTMQLQKADEEAQLEIRSKMLVSQANTIYKLFYDSGAYLGEYSISKSRIFSDRYHKTAQLMPSELSELNSLVGNRPSQQKRVTRVCTIVAEELKILDQAEVCIDDNSLSPIACCGHHRRNYSHLKMLLGELRNELDLITIDERRFSALPASDQTRQRDYLKATIYANVGLNIGIALVLWSVTLGKHFDWFRKPEAA